MFATIERLDGCAVFGVGVFERSVCSFEFGARGRMGRVATMRGVGLAFGAQLAVEGPGVVVGGEGFGVGAAHRVG